jgi:glyceraldehyde 3-phosphate dehydrogenase
MVRVAINGFGRIGRLASRVMRHHDGLELVAVNDLAPVEALEYVLRRDSVHGTHPVRVTRDGETLVVGTARVPVLHEKDPAKLPWKTMGVDVVLECTGAFRDREAVSAHLAAGARKAVISAPAKDVDATFCLGVNDATYRPDDHHVVSNASCTTNALAPVAMVLHREFGLQRGLINTTHAYTSSQSLVDMPARKLRRARAAALSLVPTSTGAARACALVLPELEGRLDGLAVRAPVADGSLVDLTCVLEREATAEQINAALRTAAATDALRGILAVTDEEIVSIDVVGDPRSSIVDGLSTMALGPLVKVLAWYDNEWGYANRLVECGVMVATGARPSPKAPVPGE